MSGNEENNFNNNNNNNIINNNDVLIRKEKSKKVKKKDKKRVRTIHVDNAYRRSEELESLEVEKFGPEDFKIVSLLGVGSQGRVYLVELVGTNIYYAMKVFKKDQILQNEKVNLLFLFIIIIKLLFLFYFENQERNYLNI